jgi:hypothetical protein
MAYPHLRGSINTLGERKINFSSPSWLAETTIPLLLQVPPKKFLACHPYKILE